MKLTIVATILLFATTACTTPYRRSINFSTHLQRTLSSHQAEIDKLLKQNPHKPISLAIVVESINNPAIQHEKQKEAYAAWAKGVEDQIISDYVHFFISHFHQNPNPNPNFSLLDRNKVNKILDEYTFQYQGLTRSIDAEALGQFANATHLLIVTVTRFTYSPTHYSDAVQGRLVSVKEAKILSVNQYRN